jgi:hypothetical protein
MREFKRRGVVLAILAVIGLAASASAAPGKRVSKTFSGPKVNAGTVTETSDMGHVVLTLSADFKVPDTPDPHWQIVDEKGNVFLLQRLAIKGDRVNTSITLPAYIKGISKVQIYCAWAEVVLGETTFDGPSTN